MVHDGQVRIQLWFAPGGLDDVRLKKLAGIVTGSGANEPPDDRLPLVSWLFFVLFGHWSVVSPGALVIIEFA